MSTALRILTAGKIAAFALSVSIAGTVQAQTIAETRRVGALESPFTTPLTAEEAAEPTGRDTEAPVEQLLPHDLGFRLGMGWWRTRLMHWGLRRDRETGRQILCRLLSEKEGRGDVSLEFDDGGIAELYIFWGYDDGWTAADPGAVRRRLDDTLRRLGPPTRRWTQKTEETLDGGTVRTYAWHVWHWTKGDLDAVFEIRRTDDATESLRASFDAGSIHDRQDYFKWLGAPDTSETTKE